MSITIYQVQNVLRTYHHLIKSKASTTGSGPEPQEGTTKLQDVSRRDRVTISEASRRKFSELPPALNEVERQDPREGSTDEETFAQS